MGIDRPIVTLSRIEYEGALALPLLEFINFRPQIDLTQYDALIITSKEALKALSYLKWQDMRVYCVGAATAKLVPNVAYSQNSGGAFELVEYLKKNSINERLLYCRGEKVSVDIASKLRISETVLYKSACVEEKPKIKIVSNSTIIFSSPSTVDCFLKHYKFESSFKAVALGKTTALSLNNAKIPHVVSPSTTISSAIEYAKKLG